MAKRRTYKEPRIDVELLHQAGYDISRDDMPWLDPLAVADAGDKRTLENMLMACASDNRAHELPSAQVLFWIGEWISRHEFRKKRGGSPTPDYAVSAVLRLQAAEAQVRALRAEGDSVEQAVANVAWETGIAATTLAAYHNGQHGGARRSAARRRVRPLRPPRALARA
jgi:hypothetical protein